MKKRFQIPVMEGMKFAKQFVLCLVVAVVLAMQPVQDTQAAPELNKENFDYDWYLEQHPEIVEVVPAEDHDAIWQFYQTVGEPAGWLGRVSKMSYLTKTEFDYDAFLAQNPDVFAAFGTNHDQIYKWYMTTGVYEGRSAQAKSDDTKARMKIYDIADSITDNSMSTREKVKAVHDWLCIFVAYDWGYDELWEEKGTTARSGHRIDGPILYGMAVCEGYARAFQAFMDTLGIENEFISGVAAPYLKEYGDPYSGGHAWNKVRIDGQWYWIDVTWDAPNVDPWWRSEWTESVVLADMLDNWLGSWSYKYFLISEEEMNIDHTPK